MKKFISLLIATVLTLSLAACGGSSGRADEALCGNYIAVTGTALGITLSGDDISGFSMELLSGGKATITADDTTLKGKWVNDDTTFTLTVQGNDMVANLGEDTLTFESFLEEQVGVSMDIVFAKEGTDAAKPENYLPEEEKALLGDWTSVAVTNVMGEDVSDNVSADALKAAMNSDHSAVISYNGDVIATPTWSIFAGAVIFDGDIAGGASLYGDSEDGKFVITYSGDDYYNFEMGK